MLTTVINKSRKEWVEESGVDEELWKINCNTSVSPVDGINVLGAKNFNAKDGFWWSDSISILDGNWIKSGEMKLYSPKKIGRKAIKYLTYPKGEPAKPGLLKVTLDIWKKICVKNKLQFDERWINQARDDLGFWQWVLENPSIEVIITEGRKKAACLLSNGYVAISINGVWNGRKNHGGEHRVIQELLPFVRQESEIVLAYDSDWIENNNVVSALKAFCQALSNFEKAPIITIVSWPHEKGKGVDDLICQHGIEEYDSCHKRRETFKQWVQVKLLPESWEDEVIDYLERKGIHYAYINTLFHRWTGTHYEPFESEEEIKHHFFEYLKSFCDPSDKSKEQKRNAANPKCANRVLEQIRIRCFIHKSEVNPTGYFNLVNGVARVENSTKEIIIEEHSWNSKPAFTYCSSFAYDPNASTEYWDRVKEALTPEDLEVFLNTISATVNLKAIRSTHSRGVRALFLLGGGSNGKDTFKAIFEQILGAAMTSVSMSAIKAACSSTGTSWDTWDLISSRINWDSEAEKVKLSTNTILKKLVTGEDVSVQRKHQQPVKFKPQTVLLFNCNPKAFPVLDSHEEAVRTRFAIIPFNRKFKRNADISKGEIEADSRFRDDEEWVAQNVTPAAFNEMLKRYFYILENGIDYSHVEQHGKELEAESNHLIQWMDDVQFEKQPECSVTLQEIWACLSRWYERNGLATIDVSARSVTPTENDKYDSIITSIRKVKKALKDLNPEMEIVRPNRNSQSILKGWIIKNPYPKTI